MTDLHGMTVHHGWHHFKMTIDEAYHNEQRMIRIVTGKGQMKDEFPTWAAIHPRVQEATLNKDGGSWKVTIKKK